jgi:hypothetical protein
MIALVFFMDFLSSPVTQLPRENGTQPKLKNVQKTTAISNEVMVHMASRKRRAMNRNSSCWQTVNGFYYFFLVILLLFFIPKKILLLC